MKKKEITIFTDGSCYAKDPEKRGGFGVYIQWEDKEFTIQKGYKNTTISRMELRAILYALRAVKVDQVVTVYLYSDSEYSVKMIQEKIFDWKNNLLEFQFENFDLLDAIFKEIQKHRLMRLKLKWIPGHQKDYENPLTQGNFIADQLASYKQFKEYEIDLVNNLAYFYHENSDVIIVEREDCDFGNENEFTHHIGPCKQRDISELREVCKNNNFGWLMDLYDTGKLDIELEN